MTHPIWELSVDKGALVLTPCPGTKGVSLKKSLEQLKAQGVTTVVTALNKQEMQEAGVAALGDEAQRLGINWFHVPIEDDCAPDDLFLKQWQQCHQQLHQALEQGEKIALHCMGGSGRTGLLAAHLLLERNWDLPTIIEKVQALRPGAFTKPVQIDYIHKVTNQ